MFGQSDQYWTGDYQSVAEFNPLVRFLLAWHPAVFQACVLIWLMALNTLIFHMPRQCAVSFSMLIMLGHSIGASSWLVRHHGVWGLGYAFLLMFAMRWLFDFATRMRERCTGLKSS